MPGIGEDIKEVLEELGTTITITRPDGTTFIEKGDLVDYPTSSTEFIRQFFSTLTLVYDTRVIAGDIFKAVNKYYLVINSTPSSFEDELVDFTVSVYRCNVHGRIKRLTETRDPVTKLTIPVWSEVGNAVRALQHESRLGNELVLEENLVGLSMFQHSLYLPSYMDIQIGDRWYPMESSDTEYYRIYGIDKKRLESVFVCGLKEDTRP